MAPQSIAQLLRLDGRKSLVTGGSTGMGRAIALALAEYGADVAIQHFPEADARLDMAESAGQVVAGVRAYGRTGIALEADFAHPASVERLCLAAMEGLGQIDILVINAAIQFRTPWTQIPSAEIEAQFNANFKGTLRILQILVPAMASRGWGRVLSIGSVNQIVPRQDLAVYCALKSAQHNLILNLAKAYGRRGVTFNTLAPGLVETPRNVARRQNQDDWKRITAAENPMGRAGQPDEVAAAALLFCSPASSFITGNNLFVDGGGHIPNLD